MLNKNSKNNELVSTLKEQLATGKVVVFATEKTVNPEYTMLYVCQEIESPREVSALDTLFLGWSNKTIVRALRNALTSVVESMKIGSGSFIDASCIQITEDSIPSYEGQKPKQTPAGDQLADVNGQPIYRHTSLVAGLIPSHTFVSNLPIVASETKPGVILHDISVQEGQSAKTGN